MMNNELLSIVNELSSLNMMIDGQPYEEAIDNIEDKIYSNKFNIALVGDFSTGKSTFINALLGEELLYHSTKEATGVITTVQYGDQAYAQVYTKDGRLIEEISLSGLEGQKRLNQYLDIENKGEADRVNIFYPINGMEKDIVFFDTPGIEKMSEEQIFMTKSVIAQSNAVLFLIKKEGFTDQALHVIAGEHEIIGKIPSNNIIVVMTHIGEIYDNRNYTDATKQIERVVDEARKQLREKSIEDLSIFALDSKEYLWGSNQAIYRKEQEERDIALNGEMLSQQEYLERSGFNAFSTFLYKFLERDKRSKSKDRDIEENILLILDAIEQDIKGQGDLQESYNDKVRIRVEQQIEDACKNQRLFYNRLIRQIQAHMDTYLDNVETDVSNMIGISRKILEFIDKSFVSPEDLNEDRVNECIRRTTEEIEVFAMKIESETNKHVAITQNNFVKNIFSEEFQKIFERSVNIKLDIPHSNLNIVLKKDDHEKRSVLEDEELQSLEKKKAAIVGKIKDNEEMLRRYRIRVNQMKNDYKTENERIESWYNDAVSKLGKRPKAKQKYREVKETKGILFWKKTKIKKIPDGMDDSDGMKWDKKRNKIFNEYEERIGHLNIISDRIEDDERNIIKCENSLSENKNKRRHLDERIRMQSRLIEQDKTRYMEEFISEKKEAVASCCESIRTSMLNQLTGEIRKYLYESKKNIEQGIKREVDIQIELYRRELMEKNQELCERVKVSEETERDSLKKIQRIREKITNG